MHRGQRIQTSNGVDTTFKEVYTAGNQHHDMRHHSEDAEIGIRLYSKLTLYAQLKNAATKALPSNTTVVPE